MTLRLLDQLPYPVLRIDATGRLEFANAAAASLAGRLGARPGELIDPDLLGRLRDAADRDRPRPVELTSGGQAFQLTATEDPAIPGALEIYAIDVSAARALERYPDSNPHPVLRISGTGELSYANPASQDLLAALHLSVGDLVPADLAARLITAGGQGEEVQMEAAGRLYELRPMPVPELDALNVYGTDISARNALTKFPDQNPNPVLRFSQTGLLLYANPAAAALRRTFGVEIGDRLPTAVWERISAALAQTSTGVNSEPIEIIAEDSTYEMVVVDVPGFEFINAYGTDVTAVRLLEQASRENERLLLNILPASIAARLRGGETVIADQFDELSIVFADLVNFTGLASELAAFEVVGVLTEVFTAFDELADRHGLEKIKTIGDAYLAAGGINPGEEGAARRVAEMALDMQAFVEGYRCLGGRRLEIRIGLHTGPAVAGVIGIRKFFYDVWGDTVNTASRLQTTAEPGTIQVLESTAQRLRDDFVFTPRGSVDLKGLGSMGTWLLTGRAAVATEKSPNSGAAAARVDEQA